MVYIFGQTHEDCVQRIKLQMADGTDIPNSVEEDSEDGQIELNRRTHKSVIDLATPLGPPSGRYNCHGLVFASRRTNIPPPGDDDDKIVSRILRTDGYKRITSDPQVGDIAVYRDDDNKIEHTGIVCRVLYVGNAPVVWVWSMWGGLGEFEHKSHQTPYRSTPEYWRLGI